MDWHALSLARLRGRARARGRTAARILAELADTKLKRAENRGKENFVTVVRVYIRAEKSGSRGQRGVSLFVR